MSHFPPSSQAKARFPPPPYMSMPVGRAHVPADMSIAALGRLALASYLPIEEAHALLAPPQSLRERLEERERERLEEGGGSGWRRGRGGGWRRRRGAKRRAVGAS